MACSRHLTSSVGHKTREEKTEATEPAHAFCRSLNRNKQITHVENKSSFIKITEIVITIQKFRVSKIFFILKEINIRMHINID